jgi:hypothetical protein
MSVTQIIYQKQQVWKNHETQFLTNQLLDVENKKKTIIRKKIT